MPGGHLMRRRRYIFVSRGLVPRSGSYPRSRRHSHLLPGGHLCIHKRTILLKIDDRGRMADGTADNSTALATMPRSGMAVRAERVLRALTRGWWRGASPTTGTNSYPISPVPRRGSLRSPVSLVAAERKCVKSHKSNFRHAAGPSGSPRGKQTPRQASRL